MDRLLAKKRNKFFDSMALNKASFSFETVNEKRAIIHLASELMMISFDIFVSNPATTMINVMLLENVRFIHYMT